MSQIFTPNSSGYICHWLVTEPKEELYYPDFFLSNQLQFEKKLREQIADDALQAPPSEIVLGQPAFETYKWQYYNAGNNWFLDLSKFYHSLTKVEYWAATRLVSDVPRDVCARVWTYEAVDLWLNGEKIVSIKEPVYKPIRWADVTLKLKAGENELFARLQDLGVRDTRNIFGIQLLGDTSGLTVSLPDPEQRPKPGCWASPCKTMFLRHRRRRPSGFRSIPPAGKTAHSLLMIPKVTWFACLSRWKGRR